MESHVNYLIIYEIFCQTKNRLSHETHVNTFNKSSRNSEMYNYVVYMKALLLIVSNATLNLSGNYI